MREVTAEEDSDLTRFLKSGMEDVPKPTGKVQTFKYQTPGTDKPRAVTRLVTTDIMFAVIQRFSAGGGETVMHSHAGMDGFWLVLKGAARFYFEDGEPVLLQPLEGMCIPRDVRYWFEQTGDEPLEILQVDAIHPNIVNTVHMTPEARADQRERAAKRALFDARDVR